MRSVTFYSSWVSALLFAVGFSLCQVAPTLIADGNLAYYLGGNCTEKDCFGHKQLNCGDEEGQQCDKQYTTCDLSQPYGDPSGYCEYQENSDNECYNNSNCEDHHNDKCHECS